jgi:transposase
LVGVEQWAEVRRMRRVEGLSAREIARRTGLARDTVSRLLAAEVPPRYSRSPSGSILDPFKEWICEQLQADPKVPSQWLRELAGEIGYQGGKTTSAATDHAQPTPSGAPPAPNRPNTRQQ